MGRAGNYCRVPVRWARRFAGPNTIRETCRRAAAVGDLSGGGHASGATAWRLGVARREASRSAPQFLEWESRSKPWMSKRPGSGQGRLVLRGPVDHSKLAFRLNSGGPFIGARRWRGVPQTRLCRPPCTRLVISQRLVNSQTADYRAIVPWRGKVMKCHSV